MRTLHLRRLGLVEYADGLEMQRRLVAQRHAGQVPDTLLLLEHPRVITLGRGAKPGNVLWPRERLDAEGFEVFETDRGGDVTYHGPGQLVGYPILDLKPDRKDVRKYVASVEELMIRVAADYGVKAERVAGRVGIWNAAGKLGAIGVHIARWITSHGFAFNVGTRLDDFAAIVPCGIEGAGVVSLESLLGKAPPQREVEDHFVQRAADVWESEVSELLPEQRTVSVAVVNQQGKVLLLHRRPDAGPAGAFWQILTGTAEPHEPALQTAARELYEETGFTPRIEELRSLDYVHSFMLGRQFNTETAFTLRVEGEPAPRLDPTEHDAFRWASLEDSQTLQPFAGLRKAARLAAGRRG